jgi:hypothetical protein
METLMLNGAVVEQSSSMQNISRANFIEANTSPISHESLQRECIIPAFSKDNESTISHHEFIQVFKEAAQSYFHNENILDPAIRVSHPIRGRVPEATGKAVDLLLESEKTIYFERMAFMFEIPSINDLVNGNKLSLTFGGVRAYNQENLFNRKTEERFKIFIGFKNSVCTNLCVSTDGFKDEVRVRTVAELYTKILELLSQFDGVKHLNQMKQLGNYELSESQFAKLVGRSRMYQHLPSKMKSLVPSMPLSDSQINLVTKEYYNDKDFKCHEDGSINLWRVYNLFTGAIKSSYIDTFLKRGTESTEFVRQISDCIQFNQPFWYLN